MSRIYRVSLAYRERNRNVYEPHVQSADEATFRQLLLPWGVKPFKINFSYDPETTIVSALDYLKRKEWCPVGTWLVVITNALASSKVIDTLQLRQFE